MKLTEHFTVEEMSFSETAVRLGLDNKPDPHLISRMKNTAEHMEVVRTVLKNMPIFVHSCYRSERVNAAVGGSVNSQHCTGDAVDFTCAYFGSPYEVARVLSVHPMVEYDQLIYEGKWVHISFSNKPRREVMTAKFGDDGRITYHQGICK